MISRGSDMIRCMYQEYSDNRAKMNYKESETEDWVATRS